METFIANWTPVIHTTAPLYGSVGVVFIVALVIVLSMVLKPAPFVKNTIPGGYPSERTIKFFRSLQFWDKDK